MKKILFVEDDSFLIDIYTKQLAEDQYSVSVAVDGEMAIEKIKEIKPDLVFLDITLPKIDGWHVLEEIKKDPEIKDTKVIILSSLNQKEEIDKGIGLGALNYFAKTDYPPSRILEEIKKILN